MRGWPGGRAEVRIEQTQIRECRLKAAAFLTLTLIERKRKIVELLLTSGGLLGIIVGLNQFQTQADLFTLVFALAIVVFVACSVLTYVNLLSEKDYGAAYRMQVSLTATMFGFLIAFALMIPFNSTIEAWQSSGSPLGYSWYVVLFLSGILVRQPIANALFMRA